MQKTGIIALILLAAAGLTRAAPPWTEVSGLSTARSGLAAGVLNNALYAIGGSYGGNAQTNVYRYDGTNWTEVRGLPSARYSLAAGVLSGALYAAAGRDASHHPTTNMYRYDGTNWTEAPGLPAARWGHAAGVVSGALYVIGGYSSASATNSVFKYNGSTWTEVAGLPAARYSLAAGVLNGLLYAVGGNDVDGHATNSVYCFNGATWAETASLPTNIVYNCAASLNNLLYTIGSYYVGYKTNVYYFNGTSWYETTGLPEGRSSMAADVLNGALYAVGGTGAGGAAKTNTYRYLSASGLQILGTNGAVIASGEAASAEKGTDFGSFQWSLAGTNVLSLVNTGNAPLTISAVMTNGAGAAAFRVLGVPAQIDVGATSTFSLVFAPTNAAAYTAQVSIVNNGSPSSYVLNLRGTGAKADQAITFPAIGDQTVFSTIGLSATASSGLQVLFAVESGAASISGQTNLTLTGTGAVSVVALQIGDSDWNAASNVVRSFNVAKANQTITFPAIADQVTTNVVGLSATASCGLPVSFEVAGGSAQITGGTNLSFTGAGSVRIIAGQAGNSNWNAAPGVTNSFTVHAAAATPQGVVATDGTYVDKVAVSWSAADGATGYQVWRNTADSSSSASQIGAASGLTYEDSSVAVGVPYYYWVKATNAYSASAFSSSDSGWRADISAGVCADYDGDAKADPAVYDEAAGTWKVRLSSAGYYLVETTLNGLGGPGWASVAADYDGDGLADPAVYNEAGGLWLIMPSSAGYAAVIELGQSLGGAGYSGMPADYDGDAKADPGVYQREQGDWQLLLSSANYCALEKLGLLGGSGYRAVAADYDGDHKADPAIYGEHSGYWIFKLSSIGYVEIALARTLGGADCIPVPADYDGDGLVDPAVIDSATGLWYIMYSSLSYDIVIKSWTF